MNNDPQTSANGASHPSTRAGPIAKPPRHETPLEAALRLAASGLPVFPCRQDKRPACPRGFKDASCDPATIRALWRNYPGPLIGVPTGEASGRDILDIDPRHGGEEWEARHRESMPTTPIHETTSGGRHYVFAHAPGVRNSAGQIAPGVDVRGDGGYAIWPPSIGYTVIVGTEPAPWPDWLLPQARKTVEPIARPVPATPMPISSARMEGYVAALLDNLRRAPEGGKHEALRATATTLGGVAEQAGITDQDAIARLLAALPETVADWNLAAATAQWGLTKGRAAPIELEDRPNPRARMNGGTHPAPPPDPQPSASPEVEADLPKKAKKRGNTLALVGFMAASKAWASALRINEFTETLQVSEQFPPAAPPSGAFRNLREPADLLEAMLVFQSVGFPRANKALVWDALNIAAHRASFHPVRNYLAGLRWDGEPRLGRLFERYFNAELPDENERPADANDPTPHDKMVSYMEHISLAFMVSAVARIRDPGCKVDHLPVLVGPQGFHKSRAIRALCADPAWFSDDLSTELMERDTKESLTGKWLVELAEMPHAKKEVERVKAFFSRQSDRYRRAYDRTTNDWPRQCVFMGSSNDLELIDATGNRRFWPVEIAGPIDIERITADRDQLWAEAVRLYEGGYAWWLGANIEAIAGEQQGRFQDEDTWTEELRAWIEEIENRRPFTLVEALTGALGLDHKQIGRPEQYRAAACLKGLGFRRRRTRVGKDNPWLWAKQPRGDGVRD
jgi:predicted P-loop ATPase